MSGLQWDHPARGVVEILDHESARIRECQPDGVTPRTKVAIVGFASSSRELAPFDDPTWSVWGLNQLSRHIPRADRWFEIHEDFLSDVVEGTDHDQWLRECPIPVYMTKHHPRYPNSVRYPIERAIAEFSDYFTSTISFMLALAILEGFERIGIWGVDLIVGTEWFHQKPCTERLIGFAEGRGITIELPPTTALCRATHRYGYQAEPDWGPLKLSTLLRRREQLQAERGKALARLHGLEGQQREIRELRAAMNGTGDGFDWDARMKKLQGEWNDQAGECYAIDGALGETARWHEFLELHLRGGEIKV